MVPGLINN